MTHLTISQPVIEKHKNNNKMKSINRKDAKKFSKFNQKQSVFPTTNKILVQK